MFPKAPDWNDSEKAIGVTNRITIRKMFHAKKKRLTVNIP